MVGGSHGSAGDSRWASLSAASNLFIAAAGAGLLSYPYAVMNQGIGLNLILSCVFALFNAYTGLVLVEAGHFLRAKLRQFTYEELTLRAICLDTDKGSLHTYFWFASTVLVSCVGTVIGYLVICADMAGPAISDWCHDARGEGDAVCVVVSHPAFVTFGFAIFVALPLSTSPKMHNLVVGSVLAALSVLIVGALVVTRGAERAAATGVSADATWFRWDNGFSIFLGLPISVFSFGNHIQVLPVFAELGPAVQRRWLWIVSAATCMCFALYLSTGILGYVSFGDGVQGDILKNYPTADSFADVAKALMALHIVLAMPVVIIPLRRCLTMLVFAVAQLADTQAAIAGRRGAPVTAGVADAGFGTAGSASPRAAPFEVAAEGGQGSPLLDGEERAGGAGRGGCCSRAWHTLLALQFAAFGCWRVCRRRRWQAEGPAATATGSRKLVAGSDGRTCAAGGAGASSDDGAGDAGVFDDDPSIDLAALSAQIDAHDAAERRVCGVRIPHTVYLLGYNAVIILGGAALAVAFPQVQVIFGLIGSTMSVSQIYLGPGLILLFMAWRQRAAASGPDRRDGAAPADGGANPGRALALVRVASATGLLASGPFTSGVTTGMGVKTVGGPASAEEWKPRFTPRSPFWQLVHGYTLLAMGLFVGVVGTIVNVRELVSGE